MHIDLQSHGFALSDALKQYAIRRLGFSLAHYQEHIRKVSMRLSDANGPRHGVDKRCQVCVALAGSPDVVTEDTEADLYIAIDRATGRAGRTVARRLSRLRERRGQELPRAFTQLEE